MFFSDSVINKKGGGALAKVWLAAHWERKLSKAQLLQTNIKVSVGAIVGDASHPMALRLSGQLLLGVVRIYSRKARYLLEDCNEALVKIKMAFRPGVVDMPDEQTVANFNAITLSETINEFDILLPEPAFSLNADAPADGLSIEDSFHDPANQSIQNVSRAADITIRDISTAQSLALQSDADANLLDMEQGLDAGANSGLGDDLLNFDFGGNAASASGVGLGGLDVSVISTAASTQEIEVGRENLGDISFRPDISFEDLPALKAGDADADPFGLDPTKDIDELEKGLENRLSSAGVVVGGIDEMSFADDAFAAGAGTEAGEASFTREEERGPYDIDDRPMDEEYVPMGEDPFNDRTEEKENEFNVPGENTIFDVPVSPDVRAIKGIKKNVRKVLDIAEKTRKKSSISRPPSTKRRKVMQDDRTEISKEDMQKSIADTSAITIKETYVPTTTRLINLLDQRKNMTFMNPMRPNMNPKLAVLFESDIFMPLGDIVYDETKDSQVTTTDSNDLVVLAKEKSVAVEEEEEKKDEIGALQAWDDGDRAFPDDDLVPMGEDPSLVFNEPGVGADESNLAEKSVLGGEKTLGDEQEAAQSFDASRQQSAPIVRDDSLQELIEDEMIPPEEEELNISLTNGESMSKSTMTTIELLQHKFTESKSLSLKELLPKNPTNPEAARMFFEILVLKTKDLIDVRQSEAYGTISLTEKRVTVVKLPKNGHILKYKYNRKPPECSPR
ncbi:sister chromatid cohesion protein 1 [Physocladia obscura]|uniref:Sister chromatid cohesion protein 1 n=1 Tax=Physocladia obscura TaxID=109957 RepID=A0AAD5TB72_9FUNG|nr:sister chromatid cohesion protein 1 [Physocladia obscura]